MLPAACLRGRVQPCLTSRPRPPARARLQLRAGASGAYGLADLVSLSVASTVGSGVFSLAGRVASQEAGPAVVLSLGIGAVGCCLSAAAYAELSSTVVAAGSVYAYVQATKLGRSIMAVAAFCLFVEYAWSCAAVAVDWSQKLLRLDLNGFHLPEASVINYPAVLLVLLCTILLANGTKASKLFTNVSTAAKIGLILFMIATALAAFDAKNFQPFISEDHGISGILRGATDSFFGFLGFDAVCALATETKDARRVVPMALFLGLLISGGLTCLAGFALVSCVPADQLDPAAGFVSAFELLQLHLAARLVGELLVLPVVAFGCLLPLGRLLCCVAEDGFLPLALAQKDRAGEPLAATVLGGAVTAVCAGLVPFEDLNDICSAAVLTCFILASVSAVTARQEGALQAELRPLLAAFVACSCGALLLLSPRWTSEVALARTLLAESTDRAEGLAWPLALVAALCAMKIQERTVQALP
ncbi:unnamed protein product [Effrenium voratum]|nr:unnamed protein product [Effrenium voratum]